MDRLRVQQRLDIRRLIFNILRMILRLPVGYDWMYCIFKHHIELDGNCFKYINMHVPSVLYTQHAGLKLKLTEYYKFINVQFNIKWAHVIIYSGTPTRARTFIYHCMGSVDILYCFMINIHRTLNGVKSYPSMAIYINLIPVLHSERRHCIKYLCLIFSAHISSTTRAILHVNEVDKYFQIDKQTDSQTPGLFWSPSWGPGGRTKKENSVAPQGLKPMAIGLLFKPFSHWTIQAPEI